MSTNAELEKRMVKKPGQKRANRNDQSEEEEKWILIFGFLQLQKLTN